MKGKQGQIQEMNTKIKIRLASGTRFTGVLGTETFEERKPVRTQLLCSRLRKEPIIVSQ
jgi:hypothetical protein